MKPPVIMVGFKMMNLTDFHAKYFAHELTRRRSSDSMEKLAGAVASAQVDLNPHQVEAALFAFHSPLSKGAVLADEVGLGKTIEAGCFDIDIGNGITKAGSEPPVLTGWQSRGKVMGIVALQFLLRSLDGAAQIIARQHAQLGIRSLEHVIPGVNAGIPDPAFCANPDAREMAKCVSKHREHLAIYKSSRPIKSKPTCAESGCR
jgi:hypothetical protein